MHERGLTERTKRASLRQGIGESKAKENLIGKQALTEEKRPANVEADTNLKVSQKGLVDEEITTEPVRRDHIEEQAKTEVWRQGEIRENILTAPVDRDLKRTAAAYNRAITAKTDEERKKIIVETGMLGIDLLFKQMESYYFSRVAAANADKAEFANFWVAAGRTAHRIRESIPNWLGGVDRGSQPDIAGGLAGAVTAGTPAAYVGKTGLGIVGTLITNRFTISRGFPMKKVDGKRELDLEKFSTEDVNRFLGFQRGNRMKAEFQRDFGSGGFKPGGKSSPIKGEPKGTQTYKTDPKTGKSRKSGGLLDKYDPNNPSHKYVRW